MGFNNGGVEDAVKRLKKRKTKIIIGGNIGKNKVLLMMKLLKIMKLLLRTIRLCRLFCG